MTNKLMINTCRRNDITERWSSAGFNIALKRDGEKKKNIYILQHGVFVFGHPSKYYPFRTGLNIFDRTSRGTVLVV